MLITDDILRVSINLAEHPSAGSEAPNCKYCINIRPDLNKWACQEVLPSVEHSGDAFLVYEHKNAHFSTNGKLSLEIKSKKRFVSLFYCRESVWLSEVKPLAPEPLSTNTCKTIVFSF